jgi:transposase-like protein
MKAAELHRQNSSMTSTKNNPHPDKNNKPLKPKRHATNNYSATDKVQAVLAVWTERCKAAEVCRQMQINTVTFQYWQNRAMEGMLQALQSRVNLAKGDVLSPRLQALLQKRLLQPGKLQKRLHQIQLAKTQEQTSQP